VTRRDALALALKGVARRPGRASLTLSAVALAAALLTALLIISGTARTRVLAELSKGGPLAGIKVAAAAPDLNQIDRDDPDPGRPRSLDEDAARRIAGLRGVASVVPVIANRLLMVPPDRAPADEPFVETAVGVDLAGTRSLPVLVVAGRLPAPTSRTEVAVTEGYLERLHLDPAEHRAVIGTELALGAPRVFAGLGDIAVRARWRRAVIVGVVAQEAGPGQVLTPLTQARADRAWLQASDGEMDAIETDPSPYSGLFVVARGLDGIAKVRQQIATIGYSTSAPENLIASVQRYLHVVEIVLRGVGAIALVVASLGIANALLAAVRERRREIGVLKAIGARDRDVLRVFLIEASSLGLLGGLLGALAGWATARALTAVVNGYLSAEGLAGIALGGQLPVLAGGVVCSVVLALVAGALPALRAARLPAREAVVDL
jgi:ABC-type antimicrobial peptide transport system permease subunit